MTKEELEKLKETVAYFSHWYDVIGEERVLILEKSIKYIADLEKENAELKSKDCWKSCEYANSKSELIGQHIKDVQNLTKAKEIINDLVHLGEFNENTDEEYLNYQVHEALKNAEQFLSEVEK